MNHALTKSQAVFILVFTTFLWGSTFPLTKALTVSMSTLFLLAYRFLGTSILLWILTNKKTWHVIKTADKKLRILLLALSLTNLSAIYLQTIGLETTSSANAGFITALSVLFVPVLGFFLNKRNINPRIKIAIPLSILGIYILSYGFSLPSYFLIGDFWILLSALCYAIYIILVDKMAQKISPMPLMTIVFSITAIAAMTIWYFAETETISVYLFSSISPYEHSLMILLIIGGTILAYSFMVWGQKYVAAQHAAILYLLEPIFATILASLFFNEHIFLHTIIGSAIVLFALLFVILKEKQRT